MRDAAPQNDTGCLFTPPHVSAMKLSLSLRRKAMSSIDHTLRPPAWAAVFSMSLGIFAIVGAEFLPASLLTPMAHDLHVTEGMAGQAVTVTASVGLVSSLLVSVVSGRADRRTVLLFLTVLLIASNILVAAAPNLAALLLARVLHGIALGGFWSLSAATIMRLVPENDVPKALAILFGGVSAATVFAAPFGSFFGEMLGWRVVFLAAAGLGAAALAVQLLTLPPMISDKVVQLSTVFALLGKRGVPLGMFTLLFVFGGHFAFFTYLRSYLESVTQVEPMGVTLILLLFGVGTIAGNWLSSMLIARSLGATLAMMPLIMALAAILLSTAGGTVVGDTALTTVWGMLFGIVPVSWSTWVTRIVPDDAEGGGGLLVATCSLAITLGAAGGGWVVDAYGVRVEFIIIAAVLAVAFLLATRVKTNI
jgi:predicted MFS family arabinose efflux permease